MQFLIAIPYTTEQSNLITVARYVVMHHCPLVCHIISMYTTRKAVSQLTIVLLQCL